MNQINPNELRIGSILKMNAFKVVKREWGQIREEEFEEREFHVEVFKDFIFIEENKEYFEGKQLNWGLLSSIGFFHFTELGRHFCVYNDFTIELVYSNNNKPFDYVEFVYQSFDNKKHILNQKKIYFLHELQNLFFTLKGTELITKRM